MIKRKYDTLLVHVENVQKSGVKGWWFCETIYKPPERKQDARVYIRLSGCVNCNRMFIVFGAGFPHHFGYYENDCWGGAIGEGGCGAIRIYPESDGTFEGEFERCLSLRYHSYFLASGGTDYYSPDIQITLEEYILESGVKEVYIGTCNIFRWIGDLFLIVGQVSRSIGDRIGSVWWIGDIIQEWFNSLAGYFEGTKDWFYGVAEWCEEVVTSLVSGDIRAWLLGFFADPGGYITGFLGDVWTWVQTLYSDFPGAVTGVLGDVWTWLQGLYSDFPGAVTSVLGDGWTWVQGLYDDFSGAVFDVIGDVWSDLQDMHTNFSSWVTGALGATWTWLTEFIADPMSKLYLDILELVKSGFEWLTQEWFSFIDSSWETFKGSFEWLLQKFFVILDESWDNFEGSVKWLVGKVMALVGDAAEDLKYQIWDMVEKVMKKL